MASYSVVVHRGFEKEVRGLPKKDVGRILEAIEGLSKNPRPMNSKKLEGSADAYRIRIGTYRVLYRMKDQKLIVYILKVSHRKDAYR